MSGTCKGCIIQGCENFHENNGCSWYEEKQQKKSKMKKWTEEEIKSRLKWKIKEALESFNEEGANIEVVELDLNNMECLVKMSVVIEEDDDFIGFE